MAQYTMWIYSLLSMFLLLAVSQAQDDDWIDPTDMLNYDAASGKMKATTVDYKELDKTIPPPANGQVSCQIEKKECEMKRESLLQEVDYFQKKEKTRSQESSSIPIFKRYLNKILIETGKLGLPDETNDEVHYDAEIILTRQTLSDIIKFLTGEAWKSGALDDSLTDILINFKHHDSEAWKWRFEDYFGIDPHSLFLILLCLLCLVSLVATELYTRISWFTQLKRLIIISFIISVGWNWMYLYKVEFAQRQAEVAKMEKFDSKCSEKMDWTNSLTEWATRLWKIQNDPCEEYFKALIVHPALMVPPTKALALTFTNFVTEPLKHMGQGIGEFIKGLLKELPLIYHVPVLILLALTSLCFCYGTGKTLVQLSPVRHLRGPESQPPRLDDRRREPDNRRIDYIDNVQMDGGRGDADHFDRQYNRRYEHDQEVEHTVRARHVNSRNINKNPKVLKATCNTTAENRASGRKNHNHCTVYKSLPYEGPQDKALEESSDHAADEENMSHPEDTQSALQESEDCVKRESDCSSEDCSKNYKDSETTQQLKTKIENDEPIQNEILRKIAVETVTSTANGEPLPPI